jgi:hypothetical protein
MSDRNSQNPNKLIAWIPEQSIGTKTSLEQLNDILQKLHNNILQDSNSKNVIKSGSFNEKEKNEDNNNIEEDKKKENNDEIKEEKIPENNQEKDNDDSEMNDKSDRISNININQVKKNDYKTSMDINIIKSADKNKENENEEINEINDNNHNNEIKEDTKEDIKEEKKEDNIDNDENKKHKNREYSYRDQSQLTESNIIQNELDLYNISQGSELYLNQVIDKLGGFEEDCSIKTDDLNNINNTSKENNNNINNNISKQNNINNDLIQYIESDSVKIDWKEDLKLGLTNIPMSDEKDNTSLLTNELNKACIRTNDNIKSRDYLSNIDMDIPRENEKEDGIKEVNKRLSKKNSKNSNIINNDKKTGIEILFNPEQKKDEQTLIEEAKKEIYNEINNMYEYKLNLVKINNKEKFSYITKYNDPDKEKFGYESDFFYCSKNSINYLNRRNNFLHHKYFSYILSKKEKNNNLNKEKEKEKKNKNKEKIKDDSIDINDNFIYVNEEINKFKKNYNEKFEPMTINLNYIRANTQHDDIKEYKIHDIEDMISFFYYFNLYSPEEGFKKLLDENAENEICGSFTTYRKVLNDGNSFKRAFSYLLLESFILQNKTKKLDYIIYDIQRMLSNKFKDIKQICNLLIDIKENSSIDYLMNSYNNPNFNFDEVMITYIEDTIKNVMGIENTKRKYQEIDFNTLRILTNVFDINLEIYYIEEDDTDNGLLKMKPLILYNDVYLQTKKNIIASNYSEFDSSTTFRLLFFLNSFYIIYTKKSDIDSTLANNNTEKKYYYVPSLPKYKCPTCKKNTGLDILTSYEAIFCHVCLNKYLQEILEKRAVLFVKSNFSCVEYYTRPIKITSDIIITFSLYKYITKNYIIYDFEKIVERICFKCYEIYEKEKINKLNCLCQLCDKCLEKILKENIKDKVCLNNYELNTIAKTKCLCQNELDIVNLMELSKRKPTEKDKRKAEERLLEIIKKRCCLCEEKDPLKIFEIKIVDGPPHFMCINCHDKNYNIQKIDKNKNGLENDFGLSDFESDVTIINDKNVTKKKIFCQICYKDHITIQDNEIEQKKNLIQRVVNYGEGKFKCCKGGKCIII